MIPEQIKKQLIRHYPKKGKMWCVKTYGLTEAQVRQFTYKNKLKLDQNSEFWKNFQKKAAKTKIGRKRPEQALVMKRLRQEGKITNTHLYKPKKKIECKQCKKIFEVNPSSKKILCSVECRKKWSESQWKRKPHPRGMKGKTHTQDVRDIISKTHKGKKQSSKTIIKRMKTRKKSGLHKIRPHTTWKGGKAKDLGDIYFRSSWERNYARYLNFLIKQEEIKKWEYEADTFWFEKIKRGAVSYLPDFKVFNKDYSIEYHEVKGWMDKKSKTKLKRMAKYYPEIKLVLIDGPAYKNIAKMGSFFSEHWEG